MPRYICVQILSKIYCLIRRGHESVHPMQRYIQSSSDIRPTLKQEGLAACFLEKFSILTTFLEAGYFCLFSYSELESMSLYF